MTHEIYPADILIKGERIAVVGDSREYDPDVNCKVIEAQGQFITPGFMDPHFHIESSSITVSELAKLIVPRGITMVAEDPHEIANVLGIRGVEVLFQEGRSVPMNFFLRVPGRVPALDEENDISGSKLTFEETKKMLSWPEALCLAGDINPNLILNKDAAQYEKVDYTINQKMTVAGQSPGLRGKELNAYVAGGVEDSHVSSNVEEVLDITRHGMKALLTHRPTKFGEEDFRKLANIIKEKGLDTRNLLLCTDDTHANQLKSEGHLEYRMQLAIDKGIDPVTVIQMVTINVADYFRIERDYGSIAPGKFADLVILDRLEPLDVRKVIFHGNLVAENGKLVSEIKKFEYPEWAKKTMHLKTPVSAEDLKIRVDNVNRVKVRVFVPSTPKELEEELLDVTNSVIQPDPSRNICAMAVVERHKATGDIGKGFFKFPLKAGAYASSMNHDSHNIFVIGVNYEDMTLAVNRVAENQGGYVVVKDGAILGEVEMPIAGLLSLEPFDKVAEKMQTVEDILKNELGCSIPYRPFYFLSHFCLPNIPNYGFTVKGVISTKLMTPVKIIAWDKN
ncbi:MAG: adenine deaminase [Flexilinea sp.]